MTITFAINVLTTGNNTLRLQSNRTDNTDMRFDRIGISKAKPKYNQDVVISGQAAAPSEPNTLWYRTPAEKWAESLPLGNGRIGIRGTAVSGWII